MIVKKFLKRRYENNGMVVAVYYYKPVKLSVNLDDTKDLYSVSLGYVSNDMGDVMYIDNFLYTVYDIDNTFKTMKMFINAFGIWNNKWVKSEVYHDLSVRYYDLMSNHSDHNRSVHDNPCIV